MFVERLKQHLAASALGPAAIRSRMLSHILRSVFASPEQAATQIQDYLAERLLVMLPKSRALYVDVGAHVGSLLGQVYRRDPTVALVGIEAVPAKAKALQALFPAAEIHNCAAGSEDGEVVFYIDFAQSAYSSMVPNAGEKIVVPMKRLDTLLRDKIVDVLKIDVERAELQVLRGAEAVIAKSRPLIAFESAGRVGPDEEALFGWFVDHGYKVYVPNRVAHDGPDMSLDGFLESHHYPRRTTNYFAIPTERRIEYRDRARQILGVR
jgi:FkbM family methyltransferase